MARMVAEKYARRPPFVATTFALGCRAAPRGANEKAVILRRRSAALRMTGF